MVFVALVIYVRGLDDPEGTVDIVMSRKGVQEVRSGFAHFRVAWNRGRALSASASPNHSYQQEPLPLRLFATFCLVSPEGSDLRLCVESLA